MNTRKKVIKITYVDEDDSEAEKGAGDFSDSGSDAKISEDGYSSEDEPVSDASAEDFKETSIKKSFAQPNFRRKTKFAKDFISKIHHNQSGAEDENDVASSMFSVKNMTEADKLLPSVLNLSESDSSDDESPKPTKKQVFVSPVAGKYNESDSENEEAKEYKDVWSSNLKDSEEVAKRTFEELEQHKTIIEETKATLLNYSSKSKEGEFDVKDLLAQGEDAPKVEMPVKKTKKGKKAKIDSDSEIEDWEEVKDAKPIPQQGLQLVVDFRDAACRKTKKPDIEMMMKRRINRVKKEYQVYMHKVHVLCWLGHGNYVSRVLNDQEIMAAALSLMPSKECYPGERVDMKYVEQITTWFKDKLTLKPDKNEDKFRPKAPPLKELLLAQIKNRAVTNKKYLVFIFVSMLRAIGLQCRVMFNFVTLPIKPPSTELCSLSTKTKDDKTADQQDKTTKEKKGKANKSKTAAKPKSSKEISQLDGADDEMDISSDNIPQLDGNDDNLSVKPKSTRTTKGKKAANGTENDDVSPPKRARRTPTPTNLEPKTSKNVEKKSNPKTKAPTPTPPVKRQRATQKNDKTKTAEEVTGTNMSPKREPDTVTSKRVPKNSDPKISAKPEASTLSSKRQGAIRKSVETKIAEEVTATKISPKIESDTVTSKKVPKNSDPKISAKPDASTLSLKRQRTARKSVDTKTTKDIPATKSTPKNVEPKSVSSKNIQKSLKISEKTTSTRTPRGKKATTETVNNEVSLPKRNTRSPTSRSRSRKVEDNSSIANKTVETKDSRRPSSGTRKDKTAAESSKSTDQSKSITETKKKVTNKEDKKKTTNPPPEIMITDESNSIVECKYFENTNPVKRLSLSRKRSLTAVPNEIVGGKTKPRTESADNEKSKYFSGGTQPESTSKKPRLSRRTKTEEALEDTQRVSHRDIVTKSKAKPKNDVTEDLVKIIKTRVKQAKDESKLGIVKGKVKPESDGNSDYLPEQSPKHGDSDDDFKPSKISPRPSTSGRTRKIDRRILSSDDETPKNKIDVWCEVYVEELEQWISVDVIKGKVHCTSDIYKNSSHPVCYIVGWDNNNYLKDLTRRYVPHWNTVTRKQRADPAWWDQAVQPWLGRKSARDREEDEQLNRMQLEAPLPTSIGEYKNHPLYALQRHLLKFEAIYPPDAAVLGFVRKEPVYARECVYVCRSRDTWLKEAKVVRLGEKPYKVVKARPKWDRLSNKLITDKPLEVFGPWQVGDYEPPTAENGVVPRNAYGNVELFKECMLPKGTAHVKLPGLNRVAKKLNIDCAPAMTGFDFNGGWSHPVYDGFVVCKEFEQIITEAWLEDQEEQERKERDKLETRVYGNWRRLIKGLLIRERVRTKYGFTGPAPAQEKKNKGPRFVAKKK